MDVAALAAEERVRLDQHLDISLAQRTAAQPEAMAAVDARRHGDLHLAPIGERDHALAAERRLDEPQVKHFRRPAGALLGAAGAAAAGSTTEHLGKNVIDREA